MCEYSRSSMRTKATGKAWMITMSTQANLPITKSNLEITSGAAAKPQSFLGSILFLHMHGPCIMNGAAEAVRVHTEGIAAGSFCRSGALNNCGMPLERATVITARSCSGKPCAVHAEATDDMRRMLAAEKAPAVPSAAGCSATCREIKCTQWQGL